MIDTMRVRRAKPVWNRVAFVLLILIAFLLRSTAGFPARAAPAAQARNLCTEVPPGYDPTIVTDMADYCSVVYNEPEGNTFFLELSRTYSPSWAYKQMPCYPHECAEGKICNSWPCTPVEMGDKSPDPGLVYAYSGLPHQGVFYAPSSSGGQAYAWTRGCYLLAGSTYQDSPEARNQLWALMLKADALIATGPCAGCDDLIACQEDRTGNAADLAVTAVNCRYLAANNWVQCGAEVVNAPDPRDIAYEWKFDGSVVEGEAASVLDLIVPPDGKVHSVQVTARNVATGKSSAPAATTVQAGGSGSIQVQAPSGTTTIEGSDSSSTTSLVLNANEQLAKILADCPLLGLVLLLELEFDAELARVDPGPQAASILIAALVIDCARLQGRAEGPLEIAAVGNPARFLPAQAAQEDLPVQLRIDLQGGPLRVNASSDQVLLDVQTPEVSVRSAGRNDFGVVLDTGSGMTRVSAYEGNVQVYSRSTGIQVASLEAGQQVEVPARTSSGGTESTGASRVGPYGETSGQPQDAGDSGRSPKTSGPCGSLAVILPAVSVAVFRRRDCSAGAR